MGGCCPDYNLGMPRFDHRSVNRRLIGRARLSNSAVYVDVSLHSPVRSELYTRILGVQEEAIAVHSDFPCFSFEPVGASCFGKPVRILACIWLTHLTQTKGLNLDAPVTQTSCPCEDIEMLRMMREEAKNPPPYSALFYDCIWWAVGAYSHGLGIECSDCCNGCQEQP